MMTITKILEYLASQDTRYIHKSEGNLLPFLSDTLKDLGFSVTIVKTDGRPNILADNQKDGKAILFYGHIDTVDVVPGWTKEPFKLTIEGNKGYGLGAYDMKGGMAAFLAAAQGANRHIKLFLAVDEENISTGAWDVLKKKKDFFDDVELIISAEPNFGFGLNGITIGRTGRVIFNIVSKGRPVHIAKYQEGLNAIHPLVEFLTLLQKAKLGIDKMTVVQPRNIRTNTVGMSLCEQAEVDIEVLLGRDDSIEDIQSKLTELTKKVSGVFQVTLKPRTTPYLTGYRFSSFPHQNKIADIIQTHTNKKIKLHERSSVGDDNVLATLGIPVITWGPDGNGAHEPDEWVDLESLKKLSEMFKSLIVKSHT